MGSNHVKMNIATAADQDELVRMLAMLRLRSDLAASSRGITEHSVLGFSEGELESLPETLIIHIVSDYFIMRKNGVKDNDIFKHLDVQRHLEGHKKTNAHSPSLSAYIKQRLHIEFPQLASLEEKVIDMETLYAVYWFTKASRSTKDWKKADVFANKVISDIHQCYQESKKESEESIETPVQEENIPAKQTHTVAISILVIAILSATTYWLLYLNGLKFFNP